MARRRKVQEETAVQPVVAPEPEVAAATAVSADTGDTSRPQDQEGGEKEAEKATEVAAAAPAPQAEPMVEPEETEGKPEQQDGGIAPVVAAANQGSVAMTESIAALFDGEELSEEFQNKASALFTALVTEQVQEIEDKLVAELCEDFDVQLANEKAFLEEALDSYMTSAASKYLEENALAIENGIKSDLYESMITDISNVIKSYNIAIDDSQVELVSEAYNEADEAKARADELAEAVEAQSGYIAGLEKQLVFEAVASDLTAIQRGSLATLAESVEADSIDVMTDKMTALKEHVVRKSASIISEEASFEVTEEILTEETETPKYTHENMSAYVNAVSTQVRKL